MLTFGKPVQYRPQIDSPLLKFFDRVDDVDPAQLHARSPSGFVHDIN